MADKETTLFEDLMQGLNEALAYERGEGKAKVTTYTIEPVKGFDKTEIRDIRMRHHMSQSMFASFMGVSKKTVEAWECGRNHPTGSACRLLDLLDKDYDVILPFVTKSVS